MAEPKRPEPEGVHVRQRRIANREALHKFAADAKHELNTIIDGYGVEVRDSTSTTYRRYIVVADCGTTFLRTNEHNAWKLCDHLRAAHRRGEEKGVEKERERVTKAVEKIRKEVSNAERWSTVDGMNNVLHAIRTPDPAGGG